MKNTSTLKSILRKAFDLKFHFRHKREAGQALRVIEKQAGKTPPNLIRRSDEYAVEVFGSRRFAPWLYVYSAMMRQFREGWIPDNFYGCTMVPLLNGHHGKVGSLKSLNRRILRSNLFPDCGSIINGILLDKDLKRVSRDEFSKMLFEQGDSIVFKRDNSWQGKGIHVFNKQEFDLDKVIGMGSGVFQNYIDQHEFFSRFCSASVATLRLTTVYENGGVTSLRGGYLRLANETDSHIRSESEICIPFDLESGELFEQGLYSNWYRSSTHAGSGIRFAQLQLPEFRSCREVVLDLHSRIPYVKCIGWDLIIDRNNQVKVMEWNGEHNDIKFSEATQGPCFIGLGWEKFSPYHAPWDDRD